MAEGDRLVNDSFRSNGTAATNKSSMVPRAMPQVCEGEAGLRRIGVFMGGVADDYRRRLPYYWSDVVDGCHMKSVSSALFMFFATFFSTVALGVLIQDNTDKAIGTEEYLLMNSIAGMLHALLGCQPLLVLRPTGPITAIITTLHSLSSSFDLDFHQYLAATGIFVGLYMTLVAGFEMSRWIAHLTRYTHEIFAFFVCSIYIHDGVADIVKHFHVDTDEAFGKSIFLVMMACLTFTLSMFLNFAPSWNMFTPTIREFASDYAVTIAVFVTIGVSYMFGSHAEVDRVEMPDAIFTPTNETRSWLVDFTGAPFRLWPLAAASALPIVFFFYMDQNVSSLYTQLPSMRLVKGGSYYHSSFLCMGLFNVVSPSFGLPFVTGSLPHSPQFVKALTCREVAKTVDEDPQGGGCYVVDNRLAPFLMYLLIGIPVTIPSVLEKIPKACIDGILVYVGVAGLLDTQLWARVVCYLRPHAAFPSPFNELPMAVVHKYTTIQLLLLAVCWGVNLSPAALLFSVIVVSIVPFREHIVPMIFTDPEVLHVLDSEHAL
eukprot:TRINITY_DN26425_c0_g1_i1.p1 TRINITY_DN26425_c0_g1~~TRINITY_DN26425_c0_g1_i1.p1  ORF type:complete len:555 (+),score=153.62 TRINITY_DN26425_c0_g1_i1:34-1665(+)